MNTFFLKQINDLIIEADVEDNDIPASIGEEGFPTADEILRIEDFVSKAIDESQKCVITAKVVDKNERN